MEARISSSRRGAIAFGAAALAPLVLTLVLAAAHTSDAHNYVFLYLGIVAVLGFGSGLGPALVAAAISFLCVDFVFISPVLTFTFANSDDLINMGVFFGAAGIVGTLGSRRRAAFIRTEALAAELQTANLALARRNLEQAEAARVAAALAETEQHVRALEETDRVRHELLANVSHELRTPLATILTATTAMIERPALPGTLADDLETVAQEARRLDRIVGDLLDMARIAGGSFDLALTDVDVSDAVAAAVARLRRRTPDVVIQVDVAADLEILGDWDRIGQILDNLLNNAVLYGGSGAVTVTARRAETTTEIAVSDAGPGVPPELRDHIFERFVRADDGGLGGGTGLGLAIVRGLADAHGGSVWLDASTSRGARFVVAIPLSATSVAHETA